MVAVNNSHPSSYAKGKGVSSLYHQAQVRLHILANQRWFRFLCPWLLAIAWLVYGIQQQREVLRVTKVEAMFPLPAGVMENTTHWCYLDESGVGKLMRSAAYPSFAVEWMTGCWSWLAAHNISQGSPSQNTAAIGLDRKVYHQFLVKPTYPKWNRAFFRALQLPIVLLDGPPPSERAVFFRKPPDKDGWFGNSQACSSLRDRLYSTLDITISTTPTTTTRKLVSDAGEAPAADNTKPKNHPRDFRVHVGLVHQAHYHFLDDDLEIVALDLQEHFPNTTVSVLTLDGSVTLKDQARWFSLQDIVVMPHSSLTSNILFLRPDCQILELFPSDDYFSEVFQTLAQQCGIHHDWYYDGGGAPQQLQREVPLGELRQRSIYIHITVDQLKSRVEQMMVNLKQYR